MKTTMAIFGTVILVTALSSGKAFAQDDSQARARQHFIHGQAAVDAGRFHEAYEEFERGYALSQRALFLFNMAECARHEGRLEIARRDYERYLEAEPEGAMVATARQHLSELPAPAAPVSAPTVEPAPAASVQQPSSAEDDGPAQVSVAPDALAVPSEPAPVDTVEIWEDWPFWTILGGSIAIAAGVTIGVVVGTSGSDAPACMGNCIPADFR